MQHVSLYRIMAMLVIAIFFVPAGNLLLLDWSGNVRADDFAAMNGGDSPEGLSDYRENAAILIWDNDGGDKPDGVHGSEHFLNTTLASLGYSNITVTAQGENLTLYNLTNYVVVFAVAGMAPATGNISTNEEKALTDFLDGGGRLYLEGGDVAFQAQDGAGSGEFSELWPYLKANYDGNGGSHSRINGTASLLTDEMLFGYTGIDTSMDALSPAADGMLFFKNDTVGLGIAHNGTYRTVYNSFQFGGLEDGLPPSTREVLMARIMHFFSFELVKDVAVTGENLDFAGMNDFEGSSDEGWTHQAAGGNDVWQRGKPTSGPNSAYSGEKVWATNLAGNYPDNSDFSLYMPPTEISINTELIFKHWYSIERGFDDANVEIFNEQNQNWVILKSYDGASNGWLEEKVSLAGYSGIVKIRFRFVTDINVNVPGWYIDDVQLLSAKGLYKHGDGYFVGNGIELEPNATVENTGNTYLSFDLRARVYHQSSGTEVYNQSVLVNLTPSEKKDVGFPVTWNTSTTKNVTYIMEYRSLAAEENGSGDDNILSFWIYVGTYPDLSTGDIILGASEPLLPGIVISPKGYFKNLGNADIQGFTASLKITDAGSRILYWNNISGLDVNLTWGNSTTVAFPNWTVPNGEGDYLFNLSHNYADMDAGNDDYRKWIRGEEYYDLTATGFGFSDPLPLNMSKKVNMTVRVTNTGNMNATNAGVRCVVQNRSGVEIFNSTNNSVSVDLPYGNVSTLSFPNLQLPAEEGDITVSVIVVWNTDENVSNDVYSSTATIDNHHDVGLVSTDSVDMQGEQWYGYYKRGSYQIGTNVTNYGNVNHTPSVDFQYAVEETPYILFSDNAETNQPWSNIELQGGQSQFHIVQPNSPHSDFYTGTRSWWFGDENTGNYGNNLICVLVTKIDLRTESMVMMDFWHKYAFANGDWSCVCYSTTSVDDPENANYFVFGPQYGGNSGGWTNASYDLSPFLGQEILIGFAAVTNGAGTDKGWYIDDINITSPNYTVVDTHRVVGQEIAPGQNCWVTDTYNFDRNATYYILPRTVLAEDENTGNNMGLRKIRVKDFPDVAVKGIDMTGGRQTGSLEEFEQSDGGLTATGMNTFEWGTPTQPADLTMEKGNTKCWGISLDEEYKNDQNIYLSMSLDIRNFTGAMLRFDNWYETEEFNDGVWLEIVGAPEADYLNVSPIGGYPSSAKILQGWPGFPGNIPAFSGMSGGGINAVWETVQFNLSRYAGSVIEVRFRFASDNAIIRPGWFMDNLELYDPILGAKYRVNFNENCVFSFDYTNFGNIPSSGGTGALSVTGITNPGYSFADSLTLDNVAPDTVRSKTFAAEWTSPAGQGLYRVSVNLTSEGDLKKANSGYSIIVEVQDSHGVLTTGIMNPVNLNGYEMGSEIILRGVVRNNGTHDETGITVNATIVDVENESWTPVRFSTTVDLKVKHSLGVPFAWTIPDRLGASYRITFDVGHSRDQNESDNFYSVLIHALPENMNSAVYGFITDNTTDSPFYERLLPGVSVTLKVKGTVNVAASTTTDETGFYSLDLTPRMKGLDYTIQFSKAWYYSSQSDLFLVSNKVYKIVSDLYVNNLKPRAALTLPPLETPYTVLSEEPVTFSFEDTTDGDLPAQELDYRLESNISGLLYEGKNTSYEGVLAPGVHLLTLSVADEMGGNDTNVVVVTAFEADRKEFVFDDASLVVNLLLAGPGTITAAKISVQEIPGGLLDNDELLDVGYRYNIRTTGKIYVLSADYTVYYRDEDMRHNAREEDVRLYRYDHLYPGASWELLEVERDADNNTVSAFMSGTNTSLDLDLVMMALKDETPPGILGTVPADGEDDVSVFTPISVTFSESIRVSQIGPEDVLLREGGSDAFIDVRYNDTSHVLDIIPRVSRLEPETKYTVSIKSIYDLVYNRMKDLSFTFFTGEWKQTEETVSGFVKDESGKAVHDASIIVDGTVMTTTDENGYYLFTHDLGTFNLTVNKTGYADGSQKEIELRGDRPLSLSFVLKAYVHTIDTLVSGRVVYIDENDLEKPVEDAMVKFDGMVKARTDGNGEFEVAMDRGAYLLSVEKAGFTSYSANVELANESYAIEITLRIMDFAVLKGRIIDTEGNGIEGVKVTLTANNNKVDIEAETDVDGYYVIEAEGGYSYFVEYSKGGYEDFPAGKFKLKEGEESEVPLHIMQEEIKRTDEAANVLSYWPYAMLVFIILLVIIILAVVLRPRKEEEFDDGERPGPGPAVLPDVTPAEGESEGEAKEETEPTVIARPEADYIPPGEDAGPGSIAHFASIAVDGGTPDPEPADPPSADAVEPLAELPGKVERPTMKDGSDEGRLALPPGPEKQEGGGEQVDTGGTVAVKTEAVQDEKEEAGDAEPEPVAQAPAAVAAAAAVAAPPTKVVRAPKKVVKRRAVKRVVVKK